MSSLLNKPHFFFLLLSLLFGLLLIVMVPPFQSPDEQNHFFRAYHLSEGHLTGEMMHENRLGGFLPLSLNSLAARFMYLKNNSGARTSGAAVIESLRVPLHKDQRVFTDFANTGFTSPTAYIPQAFAIGLLGAANAPPLWMFYAGRLAAFLFWVTGIYHAIRIIPFAKWTFCFLALLPASLAIHATLNADIVTNTLSFWLTAYTLHLAYARPGLLRLKNIIPLSLASLVITLNKIVYFPLALLAALIPASRFGSTSSRRLLIGSLFLANLLTAMAWQNASSRLFIPYARYDIAVRDSQTLNEGVDPEAQLNYIWQHPGKFARTAVVSYVKSLPATMAHYTGKFGWEKNYLPAWQIAGLLLLLGIGCWIQDDPIYPKGGQRWLLVFSAGIMVVLFTIVMYCIWMPVGAPVVENLSGRYFIPVFPLLFLAVRFPIGSGLQKKYLWLTLFFFTFTLFTLIRLVIQRYYY